MASASLNFPFEDNVKRESSSSSSLYRIYGPRYERNEEGVVEFVLYIEIGPCDPENIQIHQNDRIVTVEILNSTRSSGSSRLEFHKVFELPKTYDDSKDLKVCYAENHLNLRMAIRARFKTCSTYRSHNTSTSKSITKSEDITTESYVEKIDLEGKYNAEDISISVDGHCITIRASENNADKPINDVTSEIESRMYENHHTLPQNVDVDSVKAEFDPLQDCLVIRANYSTGNMTSMNHSHSHGGSGKHHISSGTSKGTLSHLHRSITTGSTSSSVFSHS